MIGAHVGSRIRLRRNMLGISQGELGAALGVTFQQIQKYESGANRIGASRLFDLVQVLDVPISYFFEGMPAMVGGAIVPDTASDTPLGYMNGDTLRQRETLDLVRAYYCISDPGVRKRVMALLKSLASEE
nr:helix-turn-helix transcriptional regulator [Roseomonas sp. SXEYE001]MCV4208547.1 helix-turn-helix domain-containing protein [Roseomonas sp. SXEYE001]